MINDVICASKLIGTHTSETCAATALTYSVMHVATVVSLIKTTT
ncbi:hypothetical protein APHWI1_0083 [Anaplasma phagocytophilum str. ApWI1]|uniref:Uncharacterized protein n=1 Tax=Anaplasma phagocytophilum str. ApWI1 TaxID=1359155 RepID=A0A0F3PW07_ANAPH|nr:hypothetical protein APHWEB_1428 [Anaplasma phagocytophilum str. Webster]KJV83006.1 hypothetical protein APHHGE2_0881 [Anaplasma phagocytophilum str. HGE2]KJV84545.1 hypothetical protein APHWI1_0083 [Anaplasma phagocytophilum str. ApWI1]KJV87640.1 hypothetical protein APHNYW_0611 [Anaplasma phagocytophilum str. ApNYW]KJV99018.1 hypothetical protein OTSANNIE_0851 [Anaplasma phagocytophilum str. Annie]KJZ98024.1 hypothetical protein APHDU1_1397 [Anaplasma phagocytophilum]KJZ98916.1 hypotheti